MATFEDLMKLDIRVGEIIQSEFFEKAKKPAYKLWIDFGEEIGLKKSSAQITDCYSSEELIGKQVLFIANLAPRQFKNGLVSEGMILSAENFDGTLAVTSLLREVKPGSEVK